MDFFNRINLIYGTVCEQVGWFRIFGCINEILPLIGQANLTESGLCSFFYSVIFANVSLKIQVPTITIVFFSVRRLVVPRCLEGQNLNTFGR